MLFREHVGYATNGTVGNGIIAASDMESRTIGSIA